MHHACHVERDFREQEIADHVLQAHDQAEQDLADKQADRGDKVRLGHRLRAVLELDIGERVIGRRRDAGSARGGHCGGSHLVLLG
ncbi:hypothetical protein D3C72_2061870 [compost metagenome]